MHKNVQFYFVWVVFNQFCFNSILLLLSCNTVCYFCRLLEVQNKMHTKPTPSTLQFWRSRAEWWPDLTWIRPQLSFTLFITCVVYSLMILFSRINTGLLYINQMSWQSIKKKRRKEHLTRTVKVFSWTLQLFTFVTDFINC